MTSPSSISIASGVAESLMRIPSKRKRMLERACPFDLKPMKARLAADRSPQALGANAESPSGAAAQGADPTR